MERDEASLVKKERLEPLWTKDLCQVLEGKCRYYEKKGAKEEEQSLQDAFQATQDQDSHTSEGAPPEVPVALQDQLLDHRCDRKVDQQDPFSSWWRPKCPKRKGRACLSRTQHFSRGAFKCLEIEHGKGLTSGLNIIQILPRPIGHLNRLAVNNRLYLRLRMIWITVVLLIMDLTLIVNF